MAVLAELEGLESRLAQSLERRKRARMRIMGAKPGRSWAARAADLVAGGRIDPADGIATSFEEEQIFRQGIIEKTADLDAISGELSYAASQKFQSLHNQALRAVLAAVDDLSAALEAAAGVRARLRPGGYQPSSTLLPAIEPESASLLGNSAAVGWASRCKARFWSTVDTRA